MEPIAGQQRHVPKLKSLLDHRATIYRRDELDAPFTANSGPYIYGVHAPLDRAEVPLFAAKIALGEVAPRPV